MSSPLEAAAEAMHANTGYGGDMEPALVEDFRVGLLAFVRAAVGCPQCDATKVLGWAPPKRGTDEPGIHYCPAEHVELQVFGETIWAERAKCEWRCEWWCEFHSGDPDVKCDGGESESDNHKLCGWVPRVDVLLGGNDE